MSIVSKPASPEYLDGWERVWGKKEGDLPRLLVFELCPDCGHNTWRSIYLPGGQHQSECRHCHAKFTEYQVGETGRMRLGTPEYVGLAITPLDLERAEKLDIGDGPILRMAK